MPLISILTPFKNTAEYLPSCIQSIQTQTHTNWELILVDDNSTDNSLPIVSVFAKSDSRIRVLRNEGSGIIDALRLAYSNCSGSMITRMDSDDIMLPNKLAVLSGKLRTSGLGHVAVGQVKYFSNKAISKGYQEYEAWLNSLTSSGENFSEIYKECPIPSPAFMIHRSDLDKCGAFDQQLYPEDYDLAFRFYKSGFKCIPCSKVVHHWRDYEQRTSKTSEHYSIPFFVRLKTNYFLDIDFDDNRPLSIWGAGVKGKEVAKVLQESGKTFHWISANPNKINMIINGTNVVGLRDFEILDNPQSIITVAEEAVQTQIRNYFAERNKIEMVDYFFFC